MAHCFIPYRTKTLSITLAIGFEHTNQANMRIEYSNLKKKKKKKKKKQQKNVSFQA